MMAGSTGSRGGPAWRLTPWRLIVVCACAVAILTMPGCSGCSCRRQPAAAKTPEELLKEKEKEEEERRKKKDPFEIGDKLVAEPTVAGSEDKAFSCWCKPGHWTAVTMDAVANEKDFDGELELSVTEGVNSRPLPLAGTAYTASTARPAVLPKEQWRNFESSVFLPEHNSDSQLGIAAKISDRRSGRPVLETSYRVRKMPAHQYHFVVLARLPGAYGYLKDLVSIKNPSGWDDPSTSYYRVSVWSGDKSATLPKSVALPEHALYWTGIAYLLWDDADPAALTPEQQQALLDWLHWGGQLIVSGPDSLEGLRDSFLSEFLPAKSAGTRKFQRDDLRPISDRWRRTHGATIDPIFQGRPLFREDVGRPLFFNQPWTGVRLEKHEAARFVPGTGDLLAERRVGRGRVVVSAFPLTARELVGWEHFDNFFNACLLGRPARNFFPDETLSPFPVAFGGQVNERAPPASDADAGWAVSWVDPFSAELRLPLRDRQYDPQIVCKLRYFTRDVEKAALPQPTRVAPMPGPFGMTTPEITDVERAMLLPDVGGWSDFNAPANAARAALESAARIQVPDPKFVLWVVAIYLAVLVPLNWAFFRVIGRVEWAWVAAPVIAVVCTVVVVRMARLEIGFLRSTAEVAVVEVQGDYTRAHLTRYTALYSSLFTRYHISSDDPGAQVQPFPTRGRTGDTATSVANQRLRYRRDAEYRLEGFNVVSNSTNFLHSEQMIDLGGPICLKQLPQGDFQLTNRTNHTLLGVGLLRRTEKPPANPAEVKDPAMDGAWFDRLEAGATVLVTFRSDWKNVLQEERDRDPLTRANPIQGDLSLNGLLALAEKAEHFEPGEVRLVARLEDGAELPGQTIEPISRQVRRGVLVVAHLRYTHGPAPETDANTMARAKALQPEADGTSKGVGTSADLFQGYPRPVKPRPPRPAGSKAAPKTPDAAKNPAQPGTAQPAPPVEKESDQSPDNGKP
jgi:hypothetical protein